MKFRLVRHGEVEGAVENLEHDPMLTVHGRRQAAALAKQFLGDLEAGEQIEALYSSPLRAAHTTAEALSAVLDVGDVRLASELGQLAPEGDASGVEALQDQAWSFLMTLKGQFEQQSCVVLVTQEQTIRALVCKALDMRLEDMHRFELAPASLSTIEFRLQRDGRERTIVGALNDTCHVEPI